MVNKIKKFFNETNLTWGKLIIFAVVTGIYTGIMAALSIAENTSFADISISFEWWILFGVFIILSSKSPLDSGLKCFVFFLVSQPLVYLVQILFFHADWSIFSYYKIWFIWTLFTFPMGFIGHFIKKNKWWGLLILTPILVFVGDHYRSFLTKTISAFPYHLLSTVFCAVTLFLYPVAAFDHKKIRNTGLIISAVILIAGTVISIASDHTFYSTVILYSDENDVYFDESYTAELEDASYGTVSIEYDAELESCMISAEFKKPGQTLLIITSPDGDTTAYNLMIAKNTYDLMPLNQQ